MKNIELIRSKSSLTSISLNKYTFAKSKYRQDINGLRAVAVLLVIFYHLFGDKGFFSGGYVGVDIFFVISGYLISKHIIYEYEAGEFSLKNFYLRRMRRILPVFLLVLFVVCFIGFFILTPEDLKRLFQTAFSACLSVSNIYFMKYLEFGYFHSDTSVIPLLHTWSLGVEEQFYIIWPLTLCLLYRVFPAVIGPVTLMFAILSLLMCYFLSSYQNIVFYLPATRAFELFIGACLAIYWYTLETPSRFKSFFLSILALIFIYYVSSKFNDYFSLIQSRVIVCLSTALLIYSGKSKSSFINKALEFNLLAFVGLISYSLYLWHWPIIAYVNYLGLTIDANVGLLIFMTAIILSSISWKYVEEPFRRKYIWDFKITFFLFLIIPSLIIGLCVVICRYTPDVGFNKTDSAAFAKINDYFGPYKNSKCIDAPDLKPDTIENCSVGYLDKSKPKVLIVGDSHAMAFAGMLDVLLKHNRLSGYIVTSSSNPFILIDSKLSVNSAPRNRNELITKMIRKNHYSFVVMGGYWNQYLDSKFTGKWQDSNSFSIFEKGLEKAIVEVISAGSIPVLMLDVPALGVIPTACGFMRVNLPVCYNKELKAKKDQLITRNILFKMAKKHPAVKLIDPYVAVCQDNKCPAALNQVPMYNTNRSNSHLNYTGSVMLGERYLHVAKSPFV